MITVVFMLWRDPKSRWRSYYSYSHDHVNRAKRMVNRHLNMPHRFVCVTDMPEGIDDDVEIVPINKDLLALGLCWAKLMIFAPNARELFGDRILCMDLDCVVIRDIDSLVSDHDFRINGPTAPGMYYNGSMVLLRTGTRDQVWNKFDPRQAPILVGENPVGASDQWWYYKVLGDKEATWSKKDGVLSFREHMQDKDIPIEARIVFFPGPHDPSMPELRQRHPWIKANWR